MGISSNLEIIYGKPCLDGTRIPVETVVSRWNAGESVVDLIADYRIGEDDILDCLEWHRDHCAVSSMEEQGPSKAQVKGSNPLRRNLVWQETSDRYWKLGVPIRGVIMESLADVFYYSYGELNWGAYVFGKDGERVLFRVCGSFIDAINEAENCLISNGVEF